MNGVGFDLLCGLLRSVCFVGVCVCAGIVLMCGVCIMCYVFAVLCVVCCMCLYRGWWLLHAVLWCS